MRGELELPTDAYVAALGRAWKTSPKREWRGIVWRQRRSPWIFQYTITYDGEPRGEPFVSAYSADSSEQDAVGVAQEVTNILILQGFVDEAEWSTPRSEDPHVRAIARGWLRAKGGAS